MGRTGARMQSFWLNRIRPHVQIRSAPIQQANNNEKFAKKVQDTEEKKHTTSAMAYQEKDNTSVHVAKPTPIIGRKIMIVVDSSLEAKDASQWALTHTVQSHDLLVLLYCTKASSKKVEDSKKKINPRIFEFLASMKNSCKLKRPEPLLRLYSKLFKTSLDRESDNLRQALRDSIMLLIKKREDNVKAGLTDSYGSDFLGSLLKAHHDTDDKTGIPLDDIIDECKTFYFAGHEPTTIVLGWTILLLAIHTDWQEKVRKEVLELFGQDNPNTDIISRLKIMGMVINESLRLYPPAVYIMRKSTKTRLGKFTLPAGLEVNIPPLLLRSSSELWGEDTHLFKPERFAEGVTKLTREQLNAYLPFGFGPRKCVGSNFAMMEIKIALSMILQRYKFTLSPNYKHSPVVILNLQPTQGIQIMLHPL